MKPNRKLLLIAALTALISTPLHADLEAGLAAYDRGDHKEAFNQFKQAAEAGDADAYGKLAGLYLYGRGTEKDYSKAYIWFGMAEHSGDKYAEKFKMAAASSMTLEQVKHAEEIMADYIRRVEE
ncbi:sel1 repeat family protein [Sedimenticola thiotaurini]|uniref:sel1 repeat family protein n=1 Tax=Sedimenticola thiotaurini TaxID=1543721 RepID=UPI00069A38C6|nr:sel1 repeat family protein [Sedimenticola thiotaurini]